MNEEEVKLMKEYLQLRASITKKEFLETFKLHKTLKEIAGIVEKKHPILEIDGEIKKGEK